MSTFGSKVGDVKKVLETIVAKMNRDGSYDVAQKAQVALLAVDALHDEIATQGFTDTEWTWRPGS